MNKSSVLELRDLLFDFTNKYTGDTSSWSGIDGLGWETNSPMEIGMLLEDVNPGLADAWNNVGNFFGKITDSIYQNLDTLRTEVIRFCDETYSNEEKEETAVEASNDMAAQILKELGL